MATHIVVQYIGDNMVADGLPHGNSKHPDKARLFKRTMPSVLTRIQSRHQGGAHWGRAPAKIVRAPSKITGLMLISVSIIEQMP